MRDGDYEAREAYLRRLADDVCDEREPDYYDCGWCYGVGCFSCGNTGRVESQTHREEREEYEERKADAIRKGEW